MTAPSYMIDNRAKDDPIIGRLFAGVDFPIVQPTVDDLGARIVAEALSQMWDHAYETLVAFDTRGEYRDHASELSNTASELLGMAYGEDDETQAREAEAYDQPQVREGHLR